MFSCDTLCDRTAPLSSFHLAHTYARMCSICSTAYMCVINFSSCWDLVRAINQKSCAQIRVYECTPGPVNLIHSHGHPYTQTHRNPVTVSITSELLSSVQLGRFVGAGAAKWSIRIMICGYSSFDDEFNGTRQSNRTPSCVHSHNFVNCVRCILNAMCAEWARSVPIH